MQSYTDYFFLLSLPEPVSSEIKKFKQASVRLIGHFEGMSSGAHISICKQERCKPFLAEPATERMRVKLCTMPPAQLQINGFNYFEHGAAGRTIYASVDQSHHSMLWFRLLLNQIGIRIKDFMPHVTIARNIPVTAFNKLWPKFNERVFTMQFTIDHLTILQRETYVAYQKWKPCKQLHFENKLRAPVKPGMHLSKI